MSIIERESKGFARRPVSCRECPLDSIATGFTEVEGSGANGVLILGEAAGEAEAEDSLPFRPYAQAGSILTRAIKKAGFERESFSITNAVRCRPPQNKLDGQRYERASVEHCYNAHLRLALAQFSPRVILTLGAVPFRAMTGLSGKNANVSLVRGFVFTEESRAGIPVIPSLHPAYIARGKSQFLQVLIRDIQYAVQIARTGAPTDEKQYQQHPTIHEAWDYYRYLLADPGRSVAYDIETDYSARQTDESDHNRRSGSRIVSIQFSDRPGYGCYYPWTSDYINVAKAILTLPNPKMGWNNWSFDDPILRKAGCEIGGVCHDLMWAWHHLQPDLPRGLQFASSFYAPEMRAWKHLADSRPRFYGCADVDAVQRIGRRVFDDQSQQNIARGYSEHVVGLWPILRAMCDRGLPIDERGRAEFERTLGESIEERNNAIQEFVPSSLKKIHPALGYHNSNPNSVRRIAKAEGVNLNKGRERLLPDSFKTRVLAELGLECDKFPDGYERFFERRPFLVNSDQQLLAYMKAKGHKAPIKLKEKNEDGSPKETTEKKGLERLYKLTKDSFYLQVIEARELEKMKSTYVDGFHIADDGRVHSTFGFAPATGQLSSRDPNIQNLPKGGKLAKAYRATVAATPGRVLIECVAPNTRILCRDLVWREAGTLQKGDELWGFDESPVSQGLRRSGRYLRRSSIVTTNRLIKPCVRITTNKGTVTCSTGHNWLKRTSGAAKWVAAESLKVGQSICFFTAPWGIQQSREAGYLAGFLDGEGYTGRSLGFGQNDGVVTNTVLAIATELGWNFKQGAITRKCRQYSIEGSIPFQWLRCLGSVRPQRLLQKAIQQVEGMTYWGRSSSAALILSIEPIGEQEVVSLETTTRTFIAEGFLSHNCDYTAFHALTLGFEARDSAYIKLARLDIHSYLAGHLLKLEGRDYWLEKPIEELIEILSWIKKNHEEVRNKKAKPTVLGYGFGLGAAKLYDMNIESFSSKREAQGIIDLFNSLFPTTAAFRESIKERAFNNNGWLVSEHGYRRCFDVFGYREVGPRYVEKPGDRLYTGRNGKLYKRTVGDGAEAAIAFLPANAAFGHIKDVMRRIAEAGLDERYGLVNQVHDSLLFECPIKLADECIGTISEYMEAPSTVLVDSVVAPAGLRCGIEVGMGPNWSALKTCYKTPLETIM